MDIHPENAGIEIPAVGGEPPPVIGQIIDDLLENFDCQPVLFVGAGLSRRYLSTPDWEGLLRACLAKADQSEVSYEYLNQKYSGDKPLIGSHVSDIIFEWAWTTGKAKFNEALFAAGGDRSKFLKTLISNMLAELELSSQLANVELESEIKSLKQIKPHAVITTNYDEMIESIFTDYIPIVGKGVLKYNLNVYGEVFHIHGSIKDPESIVVTQQDYMKWFVESKYFAAKLLNYFVEHPIFIFGYGIGDPNIMTILEDIGRIVADESGMINNVIQIVWHKEPVVGSIQSEFAIPSGDAQYRIRVLNVNSLQHVYDCLAAQHDLKQVNPAMLRALAARVMKLTRKDIPNGEVEVDYALLESIAETDEALPKLLGLTMADSANKNHPYVLSVVAEKIGLKSWQQADKLLKKIITETGVDLRESDNFYHCKIKTGKKETSSTRKWLPATIDLLKKVLAGEAYTLSM